MFRSITNELAVVSGNETINRRTNVRIDDQLCRPLDHFSYASIVQPSGSSSTRSDCPTVSRLSSTPIGSSALSQRYSMRSHLDVPGDVNASLGSELLFRGRRGPTGRERGHEHARELDAQAVAFVSGGRGSGDRVGGWIGAGGSCPVGRARRRRREIGRSSSRFSPVRILDTRDGTGTVGGSTAPLGPGEGDRPSGHWPRWGARRCNCRCDERDVHGATAAGFLTVWPSGETRPTASNLNTVPGGTQPNLVTVKLGVGGKVSIFNLAGTTHVLADVAGYYRGHNFDDRYYTKAELDARLNALTGANIVDGSLTLANLGTCSGFGPQTATLSSPITLPAGSCKAALTVNFGAVRSDGW